MLRSVEWNVGRNSPWVCFGYASGGEFSFGGLGSVIFHSAHVNFARLKHDDELINSEAIRQRHRVRLQRLARNPARIVIVNVSLAGFLPNLVQELTLLLGFASAQCATRPID
jgi:hypothetical protein